MENIKQLFTSKEVDYNSILEDILSNMNNTLDEVGNYLKDNDENIIYDDVKKVNDDSGEVLQDINKINKPGINKYLSMIPVIGENFSVKSQIQHSIKTLMKSYDKANDNLTKATFSQIGFYNKINSNIEELNDIIKYIKDNIKKVDKKKNKERYDDIMSLNNNLISLNNKLHLSRKRMQIRMKISQNVLKDLIVLRPIIQVTLGSFLLEKYYENTLDKANKMIDGLNKGLNELSHGLTDNLVNTEKRHMNRDNVLENINKTTIDEIKKLNSSTKILQDKTISYVKEIKQVDEEGKKDFNI